MNIITSSELKLNFTKYIKTVKEKPLVFRERNNEKFMIVPINKDSNLWEYYKWLELLMSDWLEEENDNLFW